jgi:hypothetical protein
VIVESLQNGCSARLLRLRGGKTVLSARWCDGHGAKCRPLCDNLFCCGLFVRWSSGKPGVRGDDGEIKQKLHGDQSKIVNHYAIRIDPPALNQILDKCNRTPYTFFAHTPGDSPWTRNLNQCFLCYWAKLTSSNDKLDSLSLEVDGIKGILPTLATKDDIAHLEREQASLEQVFGMTHQVMVGHVEQLTRQYEYLVDVRNSR